MFGENLKKLRIKFGLSQEELGSKLSVNGKPVSGKTIWSWETFKKDEKIQPQTNFKNPCFRAIFVW